MELKYEIEKNKSSGFNQSMAQLGCYNSIVVSYSCCKLYNCIMSIKIQKN